MIKRVESQFKLSTYLYNNFYVIVILIVGVFFRFYNALNRYTLGVESVRDANVAIIGSALSQIPLTGPFSSLGPFTFGPWYWYQLIVFHLLLPVDYSSWILLGLSSVAFVFIMYKIGELLGGKQLGFTIAILVAVSAYMISWSTVLTNPGFIFLYAALSLWIFLKIIKKDSSYWWWIALGISIGIGINTHYEMVPYLLLLLILLFYKKFKNFFPFLLGCFGVFVTFIPLLLFEFMNNWYMVKTISHSYLTIKDRIYVANSWKLYLFDFWPNTWSATLVVPHVISWVIIVSVILLLAYLFIKRKVSKPLLLLTIFFLIALIQLRFYSGERLMSYMHYMMPFIFIYTGFLLWQLTFIKYGKYLYWGTLLGLIIVIIPQSLQQIKTDPASQRYHAFAESITSQYPNQKINLFHCRGEDTGDVMSLLFLLNNENRISSDGVKLAINGDLCKKHLPKNAGIKVSQVHLSNSMTIFNFANTNDQSLKKYGWETYTMEKLYKVSAFWWTDKQYDFR